MTLDDVHNIISKGSAQDWIIDEQTGAFTYKNDLSLRIEREKNETLFQEPWTDRHPNAKAYRVDFTVYYGNSFVCRKTLVQVDGGRGMVPIPDRQTYSTVEKEDYDFARIVAYDSIDEYMKRSRFSAK